MRSFPDEALSRYSLTMTATKKRLRLAVFASHPSEYSGPLFRKLASDSSIDIVVYYGWKFGLSESFDRDSGVNIKWDMPLLDGYRYKFLRNWSLRQTSSSFFGIINPGIIGELYRNRYDAILVHGYAHLSEWLCFIGAAIIGTPIILRGEMRIRTDAPAFKSLIKSFVLRLLFRRIRAFLSIGSVSEEFYSAFGIPKEIVFRTPYAVDNDYFISQNVLLKPKQQEFKNRLKIPTQLPTIVFVGKLIARKRPLDLLQAFSMLGNEQASVLFIGDGELRQTLEEYARERSLSHVFFTGFVGQAQVPKYYALADVFVLPSEDETWGLVVNEAMCASLPVVVSDAVGAARDLVRAGENGYVYPCGDIERLHDCLAVVIGDRMRLRAMGSVSAKLIRAWDYNADIVGIIEAVRTVCHAHS
jgi:glycosyltransferase involved in cell wall biosynthesis